MNKNVKNVPQQYLLVLSSRYFFHGMHQISTVFQTIACSNDLEPEDETLSVLKQDTSGPQPSIKK